MDHEKLIAEKDEKIRRMEKLLVKSMIENELNRRGALSVPLVAEYLSAFVRWDGQKAIAVDEEGKKRLKVVKGEDGHFRTEEMGVRDLVDEYLTANPHLLPQQEEGKAEGEGEAEREIEARYKAAMDESRRRGKPTGEMLKLLAQKYKGSAV